MGLGREPVWEVQWHPSGGGRVRRAVVTRRGARWLAAAAAGLALFVLLVVGILPFGMRGFFTGFTAEGVRRENLELRKTGETLREEAQTCARRVESQLGRARRLSWMLGAPVAVWRTAAAATPPIGSDDASMISSLSAGAARLEELERALGPTGHEPPCPLGSLPTFPPLPLSRAVPVDSFGWRTSPFTGKEEAHHGVTLAAPMGEIVRAPGAGTVAFAGPVRERRSNEWTRYGNVVVIAHGGGVYSVLGHLQGVSVRKGQAVARGGAVGTVGTTGWIKVPALYLEVRWPSKGASRPLDPALFQLALVVKDIDARLESPDAGLPDDYAQLARLPGFAG